MKNNEYFKNEHDGEAHGTNDDGKRIGSRGRLSTLLGLLEFGGNVNIGSTGR